MGRGVPPDAGEITWHEAPLDDLPFGAASFDLITSSFGLIFASDAAAALGEIHRCLGEDGVLLFTAWASDGYMADMTRVMSDFMPQRQDDRRSPLDWGDPPAVAALLNPLFRDVSAVRHGLPWRFDSATAAADFYFTHSPAHLASAQAAGDAADAMRDAVRAHLASLAAADGRIELEAAYTLTSARRA